MLEGRGGRVGLPGRQAGPEAYPVRSHRRQEHGDRLGPQSRRPGHRRDPLRGHETRHQYHGPGTLADSRRTVDTVDRPPVIEVEDVTKVYDLGEQKVEALKGVSLTVFQGEIVSLMGPSGSGKSTLMNLLGFLDRPTSGCYRLDGTDVAALSSDEMAWVRNHDIGFVFQNYNLLARTTSLENAELPALYNGTSSAAGRRKAREMLALVGLSERETHRPTQLSGGQQQRGGHRPGAAERSPAHPGRRAHRQPRYPHRRGNHRALQGPQPVRRASPSSS